jgi:hypothetical protein
MTSSLSPLLPEHVLGIGRAQHGSSHLTVPEEIGRHGPLVTKSKSTIVKTQSGGHHDRSVAIYFPKPERQRHYFRNKKGMSKRKGDVWALTNSACPNAYLLGRVQSTLDK